MKRNRAVLLKEQSTRLEQKLTISSAAEPVYMRTPFSLNGLRCTPWRQTSTRFNMRLCGSEGLLGEWIERHLVNWPCMRQTLHICHGWVHGSLVTGIFRHNLFRHSDFCHRPFFHICINKFVCIYYGVIWKRQKRRVIWRIYSFLNN